MSTNKNLPSGLKCTQQRKKILEFLENSKLHPTADDIFNKVRENMPHISRTTVYNTVNKLAKEGMIKCMNTRNGEMRFDAHTEAHYHFMCGECGSIFDIGPCTGLLQKEIDGHEIKDIFICYNGVCKECRKKGVAAKEETNADDDIIFE
ncbi:MAG: transcriptional repressor [Endomicrobia bacterium]|nr:transcriptional repressor [Endomicrobiia bacterium]